MREIDFIKLTEKIAERKPAVERELLLGKNEDRLFRKRPRDPHEAEVLDRLSVEKWKRYVKEGKIKYLGKREWYYDPS
ncbi:hypothetical protein V1499_05620 [Neobacillus sp. SCS-31]|uniref:hypothetical protein n=1 Tax=Neobacillus oceani TaxID=3115292 RepID=UPI00390693A6